LRHHCHFATDRLRSSVAADRSQFWKGLSTAFYGYNRPGAKISEGVRESFWRQGMMAGFPAAYFCIKAFSETDQTEDLKKISVPTLIIQGDDDQIAPFADSGALQAKLVKGSILKVYNGASHGLCTTEKDRMRRHPASPFEKPTGLQSLHPRFKSGRRLQS
jgi:non-heme chloroperoxidase